MPKKIFELAKELGENSLDVVEKLKGLGFNIKNHMSVLSDDEVDKAMSGLVPAEKKVAKVTKKKKVAKKKAKTTKKKVVAKPSKDETISDEPTEKKKAVVKKKTVIRKSGSKKCST